MADNSNLNSAARNKNDEFYTQFYDIQREMNCYYLYDNDFLRGKTVLLPCDDPEYSNFTQFFTLNFKKYGLKKLISTSYAAEKKKFIYKPMQNLFDENPPQFDDSKDFSHGRIYTLDADDLSRVDYALNALKNWQYLEGDGDFRSAEVKKLRDEADVIVTNPPFSMFREFLTWIVDADKQFLIIGNLNNVTYKEIFPLIKQNKIWLGNTGGHLWFAVPDDYEEKATDFKIDDNGQKWRRMGNIGWFTNLDSAKRHELLQLMNMKNNVQFNPHIRGIGFQRYDNYDAIDVPYVDAIPEDFDGVMGVPVTFLSKHNPDQFEILGKIDTGIINEYNLANPTINGKNVYKRIAIRHRRKKNGGIED